MIRAASAPVLAKTSIKFESKPTQGAGIVRLTGMGCVSCGAPDHRDLTVNEAITNGHSSFGGAPVFSSTMQQLEIQPE
jgi:hypothetical protein